MNDGDLKEFGVIAVSEPYARTVDGRVTTSPMGHRNWTKMVPTSTHNAPWPIRSLLWVRSDIEAEQMPIESADLTAAVLRLPARDVLVVSIYVEWNNEQALASVMTLLDGLIRQFRDRTGRRTDVVLAGDFNRHDFLWGGNEVSARRQGEGEPIIDLMSEHGLCSLLPRGTKTWQGPESESTIDLVLATSELADEMVACAIHPTEHGSDHRAIQTTFDVEMPERSAPERLLFKNAPWIMIAAKVEDDLRPLPWTVDVQTQADQLMRVVLEAIHELTPRAPPLPYAKRWWTKDLTRLRRAYTFWRNQARTQRRAGSARPDLERRAKEAAKEYHDAIRKQKSSHWDEFVAEDVNIWKAAKYLKPGKDMADDKVPPLRRADGSATGDKADQAEELLATFFPPLPTRIEAEGERPQRTPVPMPDLTLEEIEEKVMAAKPWKAPGEDNLPAIVWKQLWHVVKYRVWTLFDSSIRDGVVPHQWRTNPYIAELAAIAMALKCMPAGLRRRELTIVTSNRSALRVIRRPRQQSGQCIVRQIYDRIDCLQGRGCGVTFLWAPAKDDDFRLGTLAKAAAQRATQEGCVADTPPYRARSTSLRLALAQQCKFGQLPEGVGKYSKRMDKALPGNHTRALYDTLMKREAKVLAQLRTGMSALNGYLHRIGVAESDMCDCGQAAETIEHFLFRCKKWTAQREIMFQYSRTKMGNLSFFLGGKAASDGDKWRPDMKAVRAAVQFAMATKRLDLAQRADT
ncbi:transposon I factor [Purpureocillium lilacinum]|uniref:Transposon I factor n=1 Tax=Purpureocillium lilacinum TaxID=33203 RepID=A0A179F2W5_PURLI|nr:transposon I factor [Purpureocillium lilacinum]